MEIHKNPVMQNPVMQMTQEERLSLMIRYGITDEKKTEHDIKEIREWLTTQNHLLEASKHMNDVIIKRMYAMAKGSIEDTKTNIDRYCSARGLLPELTLNKRIEDFEHFCQKVQYITLPKLHAKDLSRITVIRYLTPDLSDVSFLVYMRYTNLVEDYKQNFECNLGLTVIVDYKNLPLSFLLKISPMLLKRAENMFTKAYGYDVKAIHMVNVPNFIDKVLSLVRCSLSKEMASVIHIHHSYEELQMHFAKDVLPREFGGEGPSCDDIAENWKQALQSKDGREIIANSEKLITDETKRPPRNFTRRFFGYLGSLRPFSTD
ncbi:clavesin-2-like [Aricia agestis]|uniref:clavesin-2-like n=1 Tax=Aricia agestis TaxID=91739 RepID=UPI001C2049B3|nr:clavesin-2-like [Aricia agestis]